MLGTSLFRLHGLVGHRRCPKLVSSRVIDEAVTKGFFWPQTIERPRTTSVLGNVALLRLLRQDGTVSVHMSTHELSVLHANKPKHGCPLLLASLVFMP